MVPQEESAPPPSPSPQCLCIYVLKSAKSGASQRTHWEQAKKKMAATVKFRQLQIVSSPAPFPLPFHVRALWSPPSLRGPWSLPLPLVRCGGPLAQFHGWTPTTAMGHTPPTRTETTATHTWPHVSTKECSLFSFPLYAPSPPPSESSSVQILDWVDCCSPKILTGMCYSTVL